MVEAASLTPGQWLFRPSGAYLIDSIAVVSNLVYVGTNRGVIILRSAQPVLAS